MNRRSFIATILATASAPAIVRADSLMRIRPIGSLILLGDFEFSYTAQVSNLFWEQILPTSWEGGITDRRQVTDRVWLEYEQKPILFESVNGGRSWYLAR